MNRIVIHPPDDLTDLDAFRETLRQALEAAGHKGEVVITPEGNAPPLLADDGGLGDNRPSNPPTAAGGQPPQAKAD
jgi:hypothetical protein